jgi:hypothetical protein
MSHEYIESRISKPSNDIFSAGLVFYEMLIGKRAVSEDNIHQIIHRLANEDIILPKNNKHAIEDTLASILYKSLGRVLI